MTAVTVEMVKAIIIHLERESKKRYLPKSNMPQVTTITIVPAIGILKSKGSPKAEKEISRLLHKRFPLQPY